MILYIACKTYMIIDNIIYADKEKMMASLQGWGKFENQKIQTICVTSLNTRGNSMGKIIMPGLSRDQSVYLDLSDVCLLSNTPAFLKNGNV